MRDPSGSACALRAHYDVVDLLHHVMDVHASTWPK